MANIELNDETSYLCQCPKCKKIVIDEWTCSDCNIEMNEITQVVTSVY